MKYLVAIVMIVFAACKAEDKEPSASVTQGDVQKGKMLFMANCASCHKTDAEFVGPALKNVTGRWENKELLYDFIKNSADVIPRNDYAKQLFLKYRESPMTAFPQLSKEDIDAILAYCDQ